MPYRFVDEHDEMIAAIEARDQVEAEHLARAHAEQILQQVQKLMVRGERLDIGL